MVALTSAQPPAPARPRDRHERNVTVNYRSVLARELTARDAQLTCRPGLAYDWLDQLKCTAVDQATVGDSEIWDHT